MTEFVHLHVHSDYSLLDAAVSTKALVKKAVSMGMSHIALTDHGNMFGVMEFIEACKRTEGKLTPIIGCEIYVAPVSRFEKSGAEHENKYHHLVLLAKNRTGYFNLVKLSSFSYTEGYYHKPLVDDELLAKYKEGLIALSACASGEIPRFIQTGNIASAEKKAVFYRDLFGKDEDGQPNFYLEIMEHGIPSGELYDSSLSQADINNGIVEISRKLNIPLVATNDVHYLEKEDFIAHDIMLCIGTAQTRSDENRKRMYYGDQFYLKSGDEMHALFKDYPESIENTVRIAKRCKFDVPLIDEDELPKFMPDFKIPEGFESADSYLRHLTEQGLEFRYPKEIKENGNDWEEIKNRVNFELDTIISKGFAGYFLIVSDFIKYANEKGIPVGLGRGSGAGSIVAYALRITDIEPRKYKLLFERFLNPERKSLPDFDIDFANDGREDVISYVTKKYGEDKVGQIITFGTLKAKLVIKDVSRTLGLSIPEAEMVTKLISNDPNITLEKAFTEEPRLRDLEQDPRYTEMFSLARKLEGLNRNMSIHAAGIVIGKSPLIDLLPLYKVPENSKKGKPGAIVTQYSMNYLPLCGLIKMDFLGLKTLDVIKHTEELIQKSDPKYSNFSVKNVPEDDIKTFKMLGEGNSFEIFQFESDGMQDILRRSKPGSIEDLTALNAMYRPGPMQNIDRFVDSKTGKSQIEYPDPSLEVILKETYGVIVYQEQVIQVAQIIAGYSLGQADILRRAMGKKKMEEMVREKEKFIKGAVERGYNKQKADGIFELLIPFAGYGFNKSHAAAYSMVAYHTAYLKANFPAEFMAAALTNEINSQDKDRLSKCIDEARKMGLVVEPPDINNSNKIFSVVEGRIIYGFLGIKGLGDVPAEEIVKGRSAGCYKSFLDFLDKVDIKAAGKKVIELLIQTGAFDKFGITRETLTGNLEKVFEYALKKKEDKEFGQTNLFDDAGVEDTSEFRFEEFPPMSRIDRLNLEKQLIGFYFSGHPMDEYKDIWENSVTVDLSRTDNLRTGNCVLVGIIKKIKVINTSKGGRMAFASIADFNGEIEITFFSGVWERVMGRIENDKVSILKGKIDYQKDKDKYSFIVDDVVSRYDVDRVIKEVKEQEEKNKIHKNTWKYMADLKSSFISKAKKGNYTVIGFLKDFREITDRNNNIMAFGTLQDFEGEIDLVFFSKVYSECKHLLKLDEIIALRGSIDPENERNPEKISLKVTSIADFAQLSRSAVRKEEAKEHPEELNKSTEQKPLEVHIRLKEGAADNYENLNELRDYLAENAGSCTTFIHIPVSEGEKTIRTSTGLDIAANGELIFGIKNCKCVSEIWSN